MCGIFGVFGTNSVVDDIIEGLSRLEYRGYDSSGLAVYNEQKLQSLRAEGKLINLKEILQKNKIDGKIGIGHTRWATHGIPSEINAHPHVTEKVALVHNGIIENFDSLKKTLTNKGYNFKSQTDSEVIANLITDFLNRGFGPLESIKKTLPKLKGSFAIAVLFSNYNVLIGARKGSPLAFGIKDKKIFLGSDSLALAPLLKMYVF